MTLLILGDQLSTDYLAALGGIPGQDTLLMVEDPALVARRPYHRKKLVLVWSAMRHFAQECRAAGWAVDYRRGGSLAECLAPLDGACVCIQPREKGIRSLLQAHRVRTVPDPYWGVSPDAFSALLAAHPHPKLEDFYRWRRRTTGILMEGGKPIGGAWNYDKENRKPFPKTHQPIAHFTVPPDALTQEVMAEVAALPGLTGSVEGFDMPVTRTDAQALLADFIARRLALFGPYEDAMSAQDPYGYHSLLSLPLNLSLLSPQECLQAAQEALAQNAAPLASVEGFVRQILGWREFLYHLYEAFPGDYHAANALGHHQPLPEFYWSGDTPMQCLSHVIKQVLESGYSHHIERLMVLGNFALLAGVSPRALNEWFWCCYLDAYDWVVTPNVIGMSQFADGGWVATKPYIASGAYIARMSNYCKGCAFDPKDATSERACPFTTLYWAFLIEREAEAPLSGRMAQNYFGLRGKSAQERAAILERKKGLHKLL
ncbi:cryptochrome/photolyase family protein [Armatimonas rosea]|uniref:Deoxyribodipyrimidine photolyase-related protein n=1 Tax=Armatimonas rosea TaxID=685828 RepID=A0A7W9W4E3_ARMRO|nr:deoxyribodipyrimidine photolyase-related protein [Armatimonas rosea]